MQFRGSLFLLCYIQVAWDWTDYTATAELDIESKILSSSWSCLFSWSNIWSRTGQSAPLKLWVSVIKNIFKAVIFFVFMDYKISLNISAKNLFSFVVQINQYLSFPLLCRLLLNCHFFLFLFWTLKLSVVNISCNFLNWLLFEMSHYIHQLKM